MPIRAVIVDSTNGKTVGPAIPIEVVASAQGVPIVGKPMRVVVVTDADIAAGRAKVTGGRPLSVILTTEGYDSVGNDAQLVYIVSGHIP